MNGTVEDKQSISGCPGTFMGYFFQFKTGMTGVIACLVEGHSLAVLRGFRDQLQKQDVIHQS